VGKTKQATYDITVRFPLSRKAELQRIAHDNDRSINWTIVDIVSKDVEKQKRRKKKNGKDEQ